MNKTHDTNGSVLPLTASDIRLNRNGRELLNIPELSIGASGCTVIVGANGAGKSLLVRALCDLQTCDTGEVLWAGEKPQVHLRHKVGMLLQRPVLLRRSALANLTYALAQKGMDRKSRNHLANEALDRSGLAQLAQVQAHRLSGGEQQRIALARALLLQPSILFLDEATANVDPASTQLIEKQLRETSDAGVGIVMISHDIGQVRRMADHVLLMHQGCVAEYCHSEKFFNRPSNELTRRWIEGELLV